MKSLCCYKCKNVVFQTSITQHSEKNCNLVKVQKPRTCSSSDTSDVAGVTEELQAVSAWISRGRAAAQKQNVCFCLRPD